MVNYDPRQRPCQRQLREAHHEGDSATSPRWVPERVRTYNADRSKPYSVTRVTVFGSYLDSTQDRLGDLDLAIQVVRRGSTEEYLKRRDAITAASSRRFGSYFERLVWPLRELGLYLKDRKPAINITDEDGSALTDQWSNVSRAEYAKIKHQTDEGTFVGPDKMTVAEWLDTWLKSATIDVEKATASNYADALLPVRERLGHQRLQQLSEEDVDGLVSWMLTSGRKRGGKVGSGLGVRSVQLTLGRFRAALNIAVRRKLVVRNVAQYTQIPREARRKAAVAAAERVPWSETEVRQFLAAIRDHRLHAPVLLSLIGMRPAEVCGLRWSAVDLEAETLSVELTWTLVDGEVEEKGPKSEKGKRRLPLPKPLHAALKALRARQAREAMKAGDAYDRSGFVLVDELGAAWKTDKFRRAIYELMAQAKVRKVRPYDARHACLTYLATSGVPDVIVSAWAGHADLSFTKRVYIHPNAEHLKEAANQPDELLG